MSVREPTAPADGAEEFEAEVAARLKRLAEAVRARRHEQRRQTREEKPRQAHFPGMRPEKRRRPHYYNPSDDADSE